MKTKVIILQTLICVVFIFFTGCITAFAQRGNNSLRQKKHSQAVKSLETHLSFEKDKERIICSHFLLGIAYIEKEDYQTAIKHFAEVTTLNPLSYQATFNIGLSYFLLGKRKQAYHYFNQSHILYKKNIKNNEYTTAPNDLRIIWNFMEVIGDRRMSNPKDFYVLQEKIKDLILHRKNLPLGIEQFLKSKGDLPVFY